MLEIDRLSLRVEDRLLIQNLNCKISKNGIYILKGKSGCGKTTVLSFIYGERKNYDGIILLDGIDLSNPSLKEKQIIKSKIDYAGHDGNLLEENTVKYNFKLFASNKEKLNYYINRYNVSNLLKSKVKTLSLGERQKILLCIILSNRKKYILLDEALSNLDDDTTKLVLEDLKALAEESIIIGVSHLGDFDKISTNIIDFENINNLTFESIDEEIVKEYHNNNHYLFYASEGYSLKKSIVSLVLCALMILSFLLLSISCNTKNDYIRNIIVRSPNRYVNVSGYDNNKYKTLNVNLSINMFTTPSAESSQVTNSYKKISDYSFSNIVLANEATINGEKTVIGDGEIIVPDFATLTKGELGYKPEYKFESAYLKICEDNDQNRGIFGTNCTIKKIYDTYFDFNKYFSLKSDGIEKKEFKEYLAELIQRNPVFMNEKTFLNSMAYHSDNVIPVNYGYPAAIFSYSEYKELFSANNHDGDKLLSDIHGEEYYSIMNENTVDIYNYGNYVFNSANRINIDFSLEEYKYLLNSPYVVIVSDEKLKSIKAELGIVDFFSFFNQRYSCFYDDNDIEYIMNSLNNDNLVICYSKNQIVEFYNKYDSLNYLRITGIILTVVFVLLLSGCVIVFNMNSRTEKILLRRGLKYREILSNKIIHNFLNVLVMSILAFALSMILNFTFTNNISTYYFQYKYQVMFMPLLIVLINSVYLVVDLYVRYKKS